MSAEPTARFAASAEPAREPEPAAPAEAQPPVVPVALDVRSATLTILVVLALIFLLQYAQVMIIPVVLGVLLSYALEPIVAVIMRARVPRPVAAALVLLTLVSAGGALLYQLSFQAQAIVQQLPEGARRLRQTVERNRRSSAIDQVQKAADELSRAANNAGGRPAPPSSGVTRVQVEQPGIDIGQYVMYGSLGVVAAVGQGVLILFLTYFLLASGDLYRRKLVKIVGPSLTQKKVTVQILQEIDRQIESFLLVQMFTSVVVGTASWLAFRVVGLQQAAFWGLMCGLFNSIPYLGPIITSGGIAVVSFLQFGTIQMTLAASAVALAITSLEGFLLTPWLTSRAARMNAVAVFVGLLFWGWVWNVWGMLLAVPMLMVIKAVCDHVEDFKGVGELLGD
jgi:predicted PurR-regulated permease PerM